MTVCKLNALWDDLKKVTKNFFSFQFQEVYFQLWEKLWKYNNNKKREKIWCKQFFYLSPLVTQRFFFVCSLKSLNKKINFEHKKKKKKNWKCRTKSTWHGLALFVWLLHILVYFINSSGNMLLLLVINCKLH